MRQIVKLAAAATVILLSACTEQYVPVFGDPEPMTVPAGQPAYGPRLSQSNSSDPILSWMESTEDSSDLKFSKFSIDEWGPANTAVSDADMFVNWADLPAVSALGKNRLLAHWLSYTSDGTYSYQILTSLSDDDGATWSPPLSPHSDATPTEHGFVSTYSTNSGTGFIWLDGRETPDAGMTLRAAMLSQSGDFGDEVLLDNLVCDCCQTDVASADSGPVAVYRNRSDDEVRDIYVSRQIDGQWQAGTPVSDDGWVIAGCPVNGPAVAAFGKQVVVAWFTAANDSTAVKVAVSGNSGKSFSEPLVIASKNVLGHVTVDIVNADSYAVSWMASDNQGSYAIKLQGLTFDGQPGRIQTIGRTAISRSVPQMVRVNDELIFAWTDEIGESNKIASVKVKIRGFYD